MQDKRGLSAIIATLLIILLVIVAAGIVWVVVRNIIIQGAEEIELGKFTFDLTIKSAYIDGSDVKVSVRRSPGGGDLIGVRFVFFDGTDSISVDRTISLLELQEKSFSFDSSEVGDVGLLEEVSVAPIYELDSGTEKVGSITDTATISGSSPGNGNGGTGLPGTGYCGDDLIQSPNGEDPAVDEICDGLSLDGEDCESQGFEGGDLECNVDCLSFDVSSCTSGTPDSCDGSWSPPEDSEVDCDGTPLPNGCSATCVCETGFTADGAGGCDLNPEIDTGIINSVWNIIYFDSQTFPKSQVTMQGYIGYYVNFSNSDETACFRIDFADYVSDPADMSYVRLDDSLGFPNINDDGDEYHVWEAENCGA